MLGSTHEFPDDIRTADIARLSLEKLLDHDESETERLFHACQTYGFFHLITDGAEGRQFQADLQRMYELDEALHSLPEEAKMKHAYAPPKQLFGFKQAGRNKVESGAPDRYEAWTLSQDDILGTASDPKRPDNPEAVQSHRDDIASFIRGAHRLVELICSHLDKHLELPAGTLAGLQSLAEPSQTSLRLLRYLPQPPGDRRTSLVGHTDIGTITILGTNIGGLQVLPPGSTDEEQNWAYVKPEDNCVVVNMGDAMAEWSGGILRSDLHRVSYAPGAQANDTKLSVAYLARPQKDALMAPLDFGGRIPRSENGERHTALEWERIKSEAIISGRDVPRSKGGYAGRGEVDVSPRL
ncbi:MAG: hypothetical protein Q9191_002956 [Dirinaria sp. TL-2023a]